MYLPQLAANASGMGAAVAVLASSTCSSTHTCMHGTQPAHQPAVVHVLQELLMHHVVVQVLHNPAWHGRTHPIASIVTDMVEAGHIAVFIAICLLYSFV